MDEVLDYLGYTGRVLRVYVNDNIEKNIRRAFEDLRPNGECRGAGRAAYARQMADMCFGVNETRLATKRLGQLFTVGRVQTPTLGLVVSRDEAIEHHVSRKYYELEAQGVCPDADGPVTFKLKPGEALLAGERHVFEREPLDALKTRLDGTDVTFSTALSEKVENPPLPYNLTVLLSDMSRRYGFAAAKTQQITQDLRDKYKAITYNRSDSQYLKEEHFKQAPEVLAQAMRNLGVSWELDYSLHSKAFNEEQCHRPPRHHPAGGGRPGGQDDAGRGQGLHGHRGALCHAVPPARRLRREHQHLRGGRGHVHGRRVQAGARRRVQGHLREVRRGGRRGAAGRESVASRRGAPPLRHPVQCRREGDRAAQALHRGHPHRRHGLHRQVREGPGGQGHPEGRRTTARRASTAASAPRPRGRPSSKSSRSAATSRR